MSPDLVDLLRQHDARISEVSDARTVVEHFGDVKQELDALRSSAVVCPLPDYISIRVAGDDRAKFLHNFCTNNINDLDPGQSCEVFFCDVKARILAHGYVLAGAESHEIQMLPGDAEALISHLNRYIITEDVTLTCLSVGRTTFAVAGPAIQDVLGAVEGGAEMSVSSCCLQDDVAMFRTTWDDLPVAFVSVNNETGAETWRRVAAHATAAGNTTFHHLRITEGYPLMGTDLTGDNMAPEADRNDLAISYRKGCYLGQEPIARLDAMGHVNQKLFKGRATVTDRVSDSEELPIVTSRSLADDASFPVLLPMSVRLASSSSAVMARTRDGAAVHLDRLV
ncbi:MAG: hypothetical protein GY758_15270 [Fuerstiella sp.]|nr:hypothetical protein [Fuerstiella sp.]